MCTIKMGGTNEIVNFDGVTNTRNVFNSDLMSFALYGTLEPDLPQQIVEYRNLWDKRIRGISDKRKKLIMPFFTEYLCI